MPGGYDDFSREFDAVFSARFNHPADNWNAVGYGNMRVILSALKNAGEMPTRESFRDALAATKDVPVPSGQGNYSLDEHRALQIGMNVLVVKDGPFKIAP